MTVWIVVCFYFDNSSIEAVFSNEDAARSEQNRLRAENKLYHYYDVEAYVVRN